MIEIKVGDYAGREHVIRSADDMNRLVRELDLHRDQLADLMLGGDRHAAMQAEQESDTVEDMFVPAFQREIARVRALLESDAADEYRHAKARAIKARHTGGAS